MYPLCNHSGGVSSSPYPRHRITTRLIEALKFDHEHRIVMGLLIEDVSVVWEFEVLETKISG